MSEIHISKSFREEERTLAATLFWEAFSAKLSLGLGPEQKATAFLSRVMDPDYAIAARDTDGTLLGLAGFKTSDGALAGGSFNDLRTIYGLFGSIWRAALMSLLERSLEEGVLLMDGIFVTEAARGKGAGTALLQSIKDEAALHNCTEVRLDVINTNPRAKALYKRAGFVEGKTQHLGPLRHVFGFTSATEMRYTLRARS